MDDAEHRFARELADAIAAAVEGSADVEACRERARAAGFDMRVTLEAVIGFSSRDAESAMPAKLPPVSGGTASRRSPDMTANDRRFLRSLHIAADETPESVE